MDTQIQKQAEKDLTERTRESEQASQEPPRIHLEGWVGENVAKSRGLADRLGITADIERLSYEGLVAADVVKALDSRLDGIGRAAEANGESPAVAKREFVRETRVSLGIPSQDDPAEFQAARDQYFQSQATKQTEQQDTPIRAGEQANEIAFTLEAERNPGYLLNLVENGELKTYQFEDLGQAAAAFDQADLATSGPELVTTLDQRLIHTEFNRDGQPLGYSYASPEIEAEINIARQAYQAKIQSRQAEDTPQREAAQQDAGAGVEHIDDEVRKRAQHLQHVRNAAELRSRQLDPNQPDKDDPEVVADAPSAPRKPGPIFAKEGYGLPRNIHSQYVVHEGKFYHKEGAGKVHFEDKGKTLSTASNDRQIAANMVAVAMAKNWTTLSLKGTEEFRRNAWLEAELNGLNTRGFKPKEQDLALLELLRQERSTNRIEGLDQEVKTAHPEYTARAEQQQAPQAAMAPQAPSTPSTLRTGETSPPTPDARKEQAPLEVPEKENGLVGKLLEHGPARFNFDPKEQPNYYVRLDNGKEVKTVWGVDLERALKVSQALPGEKVGLQNLGRKEVTVTVPIHNEQGEVVRFEEKHTHRNEWAVHTDKTRQQEAEPRERGQSKNAPALHEGPNAPTPTDRAPQPSEPGIQIRELEKQLAVRMAKADWYAHYSDDSKVQQAGEKEVSAIHRDLEHLSQSKPDAAWKLWQQHAPEDMTRPGYLVPPQKEPQRPKAEPSLSTLPGDLSLARAAEAGTESAVAASKQQTTPQRQLPDSEQIKIDAAQKILSEAIRTLPAEHQKEIMASFNLAMSTQAETGKINLPTPRVKVEHQQPQHDRQERSADRER